MLERLLKTFLSIEGRDHVVFAAQCIDDELIHVWVVFDDQDRPSLQAVWAICFDRKLWRLQLLKHARRRSRRNKILRLLASHCICRGFEWERYHEERSTTYWSGLPDRPVMELHKFLCN